MALILPLHVFEGIYRLLPRTSNPSPIEQKRLATFLTANASLFDLIRWRRVSQAFKLAANDRLKNFKRIDVRCYNGLSQLYEDPKTRAKFEWHPHASMFLLQTGRNELGIAIDSKLKTSDVSALIQLLSSFRHNVEHLFVDSPVIELLVSQINRQQVALFVEIFKFSRTPTKQNFMNKETAVSAVDHSSVPDGPFFPKLKKLTVTSNSNQLEYLSRLGSYAVGVDLLYETSNMDLLCLKICMGNSQWTQKPNIRLFRHVTRFKQWTDAGTLGERYFQQFSVNRLSNKFQ